MKKGVKGSRKKKKIVLYGNIYQEDIGVAVPRLYKTQELAMENAASDAIAKAVRFESEEFEVEE